VARNSTRHGITEALALAGVDATARGAQVSEDIQMVYVMDDLRALLAVIPRPQFVHTSFSASNAARRGITELSPPADSAIIIPWFRNDDNVNSANFSVTATPRITNDIITRAPSLQVNGPSRSLLQDGTTSIGAGQVVLGIGPAEVPANFPPLVIPPGSFFSLNSVGLNQSSFVTLAWLEVPLRAAATAL